MGKPESPVGMVEIAGRSGQKHRGFLEAGLLLLLLMVTGALVTLGLLYADSRGEWGRPLPPDGPPAPCHRARPHPTSGRSARPPTRRSRLASRAGGVCAGHRGRPGCAIAWR